MRNSYFRYRRYHMVSIAKAHSAFTSQSIAAWERASHASLLPYCTIPVNHVITWHAVWLVAVWHKEPTSTRPLRGFYTPKKRARFS